MTQPIEWPLYVAAIGLAAAAVATWRARRDVAHLKRLLDSVAEEARHTASRAFFDGVHMARMEDLNLLITCVGEAPEHARNTIRHLAGVVASIQKLQARDNARRQSYEKTAANEEGRGRAPGEGAAAKGEGAEAQAGEAAPAGHPVDGPAKSQEAGDHQEPLLRDRGRGGAEKQLHRRVQRPHQGAEAEAGRAAQ